MATASMRMKKRAMATKRERATATDNGRATVTRAMATAKMWAMATATRVADYEGIRERRYGDGKMGGGRATATATARGGG
jgi:hypothetical protein